MSRSRRPTRSRVRPPASRTVGRGRSLAVLFLLLLLWSVCLGWGLAQAAEPNPSVAAPTEAAPSQTTAAPTANPPDQGAVDYVDEKYRWGQQLYLENCASCHIGVPPAIMPTQTWQQLLPDPQHYGMRIEPLDGPRLQIAWQYLRTFSRPIREDERVPYRIAQSRFFTALHPKVEFTERVTLKSCVSCHPGGDRFDFRTLSAKWQNAP